MNNLIPFKGFRLCYNFVVNRSVNREQSQSGSIASQSPLFAVSIAKRAKKSIDHAFRPLSMVSIDQSPLTGGASLAIDYPEAGFIPRIRD